MRDLTKEIAHPHRSHGLIWVIALLISALLVWSYFTTFNRVVRATGQVISVARTQLVQNLEGGILTALDVHEGDQVVEGQPLAQFDTTRYEALVDEGEKKIATLVLREARLRSELAQHNELTIPSGYAEKYPELVASEQALWASKRQEYQSRQQNYQQMIGLKQQELNQVKRFRQSGAIASRELVALEQGLATLQAEKENYLAEYHKRQATELSETVAQLALLTETVKTTRDQLRRASVLSPASGTVNQIFINTIGAVVSPGQTILEIVPNHEGKMLIETRVLPKDIGYVTLEMGSTLKLTAYDYTIYGTLKGKVVKIGADTVPDKQHRDQPPSYVVTLEMDEASLSGWLSRGLEIRTGMVVEAELEAGRMRIIDYILRPLLKTRDAMATI